MDRLSHHDVAVFFLALGVLLIAARLLGELAARFGQPAVLGEILAGLLLGPSVLGRLAPDLSDFFLPRTGVRAVATDAFLHLSVVLFLLVAGLEINLSGLWRQGRKALLVSTAGGVIPFALGFGLALTSPWALGMENGANRTAFALFFGVALAITALPVIARMLMDLNLLKSDLGVLVIAAATFNDLTGWIVFSMVLGMIGANEGAFPAWATALLTLGFFAFMMTVFRAAAHRAMPWILAHARRTTGVLALVFAFAFLGAAFAEWIGIHGIFGAFLVGVAFGSSSHLREGFRRTLDDFVSSLFAPVFFASIGLRVDFLAHFDPSLCALVLLIACGGKILGCAGAGRLAGLETKEAWALGFCMNARGVMEIVLGLIALQYGLIGDRLFVALVFMAIVTSMMVGPTVQRSLRRRRAFVLHECMRGRAVVDLKARTAMEAIDELIRAAAEAIPAIDAEKALEVASARERVMSTGLGDEIAAPHARLPGLPYPVVVPGRSRDGVDFDAADGKPARLVFLILTPTEDEGAQVQLLGAIARAYRDPALRAESMRADGFVEFVAALRGGPR